MYLREGRERPAYCSKPKNELPQRHGAGMVKDTTPPLRSSRRRGPRRNLMDQEARIQRRAEAAAAFDQHENRGDGARVAGSLADGLNLLCDFFYTRIHGDVEKVFGMDSMLVPVSPLKSEENTKREIDLYQIVESAEEVRVHGYSGSDDDWYLNWLARLRLGDLEATPAVRQRFEQYFNKPHQERRRAFGIVLQRTLPEANQAPLIVHR